MEYGCIGEKLTHSFSKEIHNLLFDYDYEIKELSKDELQDFMTQREFKAINVTIPYKQAVIPYLDFISDTAQKIGAVNTIVNRDGKLYGYNTDFAGMTDLLKINSIDLKGKKVLILGSGGTSKTATAVAEYLGAQKIIRVSRTAKEDCITYDDMYKNHTDSRVIINTTPCGMYPNTAGEPIDLDKMPKINAVIDAIYNPLSSNLVVKAKQKGIKATGGLYMLVSQAASAAELFTDTKVAALKVYDVFKKIEQQKRNIVLIGMPSSGKTTIGKELAHILNMQFIDTDDEIIGAMGKTAAELINTQGEAAFRDIESKVVLNASAKNGCVIATGGGVVLREQNVTALRGNGTLYFIDRPLEMLVSTADRPLSSSRSELEKRYNERYQLYLDSADKVIKNDTEINAVLFSIKDDFLK